MTIDRNKVIITFLGVLTLIAAGVVMKIARRVILPFVIAWLLSFVLAPIVHALSRMRIPHVLGVCLVLLLLLSVCFMAGYFLNTRVAAFAESFPRYQERFAQIGREFTKEVKLPPDLFSNIDVGDKLGAFLLSLSGSFVAFASGLVTVFIFLVFVLLAEPYSEYKIRKAFSPDRAERINRIMKSVSKQISRYLAVQTAISLGTGVTVWALLSLIGVDFAATWGAFAFLLNYIPTIGSVIASIPPIAVALVQFYPDMIPATLTLAAVCGAQVTWGNFVSPKWLGGALNLSPVTVLLALLFWGWLWGPVGAIISVPVTAAVKIVCDNVEPLRPIGIFMGSGKRYARDLP